MIRVLMCGPDAESGGVATHKRCLTEALRESGVEVVSYDISGSTLRKMYQKTLGLILGAVKERTKYDIIHVQASWGIFSFVSALSGVLASKLVRTPLIVTYHNSRVGYLPLFKLVLQNVSGFILVSNLQKESILKHFPEFSNVVSVIPNGFDEKSFCKKEPRICRESLKLPVDKKIVLTVGNLLEVKGHRFLVDAICRIQREDILYIVIGDGPLKNALADKIVFSHLSDRVNLVGLQPHDEIPLWINACDLFVLPSLNEGNPTVMFEALGCGKPFVGTRVGGVPEVITSDEYGLLVEPANSDDLAEKILVALDREWDHEAILRHAEQFTWKNIAQQLIEVYDEVSNGCGKN